MPRIIEITELVLRDAHQSLFPTRMSLEDMIPACEDLDNAWLLVGRVLGRGNVRRLRSLSK